jgi:hypothetical protein
MSSRSRVDSGSNHVLLSATRGDTYDDRLTSRTKGLSGLTFPVGYVPTDVRRRPVSERDLHQVQTTVTESCVVTPPLRYARLMPKSGAERQREYRRRKAEKRISEEREWILETLRKRGRKPPSWLTPTWRPSAKYWAWKGNLVKRAIAETERRYWEELES